MPKIISIFNHKGGVGKTTLAFNLGCEIARQGKRTLLVDCDPQCNLTSLAFDEARVDEIYDNNEYTLARALAPMIPGTGDIEVSAPARLEEFNIDILPGDLTISRFEDVLAREWNNLFRPEERAARLVSGLRRVIDGICTPKNIEYAIIDLGPSIGPLNQSAILSSDFFLVPTTPDIYSVRAVDSVTDAIKRWIDDYNVAKGRFKQAALPVAMPHGTPQFIGYAAQKFGIYRAEPAQSFQRWIDRIDQTVRAVLVPQLMTCAPGPMVVAQARQSPRVAELQNYHSLVPAAQEAHRPIWALRGNTDINAGHMEKVRQCGRDMTAVVRQILQRAV